MSQATKTLKRKREISSESTAIDETKSNTKKLDKTTTPRKKLKTEKGSKDVTKSNEKLEPDVSKVTEENSKPDGKKHMVYVRNIGEKTTKSLLHRTFSKIGQVKGLFLTKKRIAEVNFSTESAALSALKLDGTVLDGATITVSIGHPKKKDQKSKNSTKKTEKVAV
jgi:RNA recognition motif-containing protein